MFEAVSIFYRGLILGLMIAAPVGPIGLLCIRRTIQKGLVIGLATGLGAAFADAICGAVAALGVSAITDFITHYEMAIRILGGVLLLFGAWHTWHDVPKPPSESEGLARKFLGLTADRPWTEAIKALVSSFVLTMTNPVTIVAVIAVIATFSNVENRFQTVTLVGGIFSGSTLWWVILSGGIALVRGHFTETRIMIVNRATATLIAGIAAWAMLTGLGELFRRLNGV